MQDDGFAVVVVGVEAFELFEQEGGCLVDGVLVYGDAGVAGGDQGPEHAGRGVTGDHVAGPTAIRGLGGDQGGDQGARAFRQAAGIHLGVLARIGIGEGGGRG